MSAAGVRQSGIGVPLFSLVSSRSWGIGEFADLPAFGRGAAADSADVQLLPLNETSPVRPPYSSMTAMALDPIYIRVPDVEAAAALGGESALDGDDRRVLAEVQTAPRVRYAGVRTLKSKWLRRAYLRFVDEELVRGTPRGEAFRAYEARESWWLDAYATFRAVHAAHQERAWWEWPPALAYADPAAVRDAAVALGDELPRLPAWIAETQADRLRRPACGVRRSAIHGVGHSPDVCKQEFMLDATVGVARRVQRQRPGLGTAAMALDGDAEYRLPVDAGAGAADRGALRRGAHRPPGGPLPRLHPAAGRVAAQGVLAARRTLAERARGQAARHLPGERRRGDRGLGTVPDFVRWSMARLGARLQGDAVERACGSRSGRYRPGDLP
jgi:hypothetical protein